MLVHGTFEATLKGFGDPYVGGQSFKNGIQVPYGTLGSVRTDGGWRPSNDHPIFVELKTGGQQISKRQAEKYRQNLPKGSYIMVIKVE